MTRFGGRAAAREVLGPGRVPVVVPGRVPVVVPGRVEVVVPGRVDVAVPGRVEVAVPGRVPVVVPGRVPAVVPGRVPVVVPGRVDGVVLGRELVAGRDGAAAGRDGAVVVCCPIVGCRCCAGAGLLAGAFLFFSCAHMSRGTNSRAITKAFPANLPVRRGNFITTS